MAITPLPYLYPNPARKTRSRTDTEIARASRGTDTAAIEREELILEYLPLVKFIAQRIAGRLPSHVELDDLIESGIIGLIDALTKYDPGHRTKFKTYAEFRIRGAILDELRALDWVPRSTRQKATQLDRAYGELEQRLGRPATDAEMMAHLGLGPAEFDEIVAEARGVALVSLDELRSEGGEGFERSLIDYLADPQNPSPINTMGSDQLQRILAETIDLLPEKERLVISLYYYEELTMKEIGEVLDVTESRVSQIHTKAILRLRGRVLKALEE